MTDLTPRKTMAKKGAVRAAAVLEARSVAIVGASADPNKIAGRPLAYMVERGFAGQLYPVNPKREQVQGLKSYPSLAAIGKPVDLVIVGTPAGQVEAVIREGIAAGTRAFVVFSSGFSELSNTGAALQARLSALAREHEVTVLGPNCLGAINSETGLIASFTTAMEETPIKAGGFSLVSQSGALGAYWLDICLRSGLGFGKWIATGNECDLDAADAIAYLAEDDQTKVIGLYVEDIRDTYAFRSSLCLAARCGKPVIVIKAGRSSLGAAAAASHTGALAGDDALYEACLRQYGALRVNSLGEMIDVARLFLFDSIPLGSRVATMSVSGGAGVLIADFSDQLGLDLPPLSPQTEQALANVLPPFVKAANPLDLTGNVVQDSASISLALQAVAADPNNDVIVLFVGLMHSIATAFTDAIAQVRRHTDRPIVVIWIGAMDETVAILEKASIPVFRDIPQAMTAIAGVVRLAQLRKAACGQRLLDTKLPRSTRVRGVVSLAECVSKDLLRKVCDLNVPAGILVQTEKDVMPLAGRLSYPLVAKLQAGSLVHKSDIGGVMLGIENESQLVAAISSLRQIARGNHVDVLGILIEPMVPFDHEMLLGLRRDPRFGPTLTLGRGGVEVELDADIVSRLLPLDAQQVEGMIRSLRSARGYDGFRGRGKVDIATLSADIAKLCQAFVDAPELAEIEINPLAVQSGQAWVLDAVVRQFND